MKSALQIYLSYRKYTPVALQTSVSKQLGMIVVIPCYNEPDLLATLQSLYEAERPVCHVEVLVVVNSAEDTSLSILDQNRKTLQEIAGFGQNVNTDCFRVVTLHQTGQPPKYAGVGLARKAGMDEAVSRFATIGNECGVIISMDADCLVASDYFVQIEQQFCLNPRLAVATIRFEHTLPRGDARLREAMVQYELYLRYYKQALCFIGFPYAYYTIGSAFVVRADAYCRSGGMGRQQSGEDQYL